MERLKTLGILCGVYILFHVCFTTMWTLMPMYDISAATGTKPFQVTSNTPAFLDDCFRQTFNALGGSGKTQHVNVKIYGDAAISPDTGLATFPLPFSGTDYYVGLQVIVGTDITTPDTSYALVAEIKTNRTVKVHAINIPDGDTLDAKLVGIE